MPNSYLDRLHTQYDEIRTGIDTLVQRAADDGRDVTDDEQAQVDRDRERLAQLEPAITHYTELETHAAHVADLRSRVRATPPVVTQTGQPVDVYDVAREFPSAAHYAITVHRAMVDRDPEAQERLERATQHQLLANNPGIVPTPVLGPLVNLIDTSRPFIQSIGTRALPAGKFDRPRITQHVAVGVQATEKTLTASQQMTIDEIPVTAKTYAGHLNISRQNVKWTSPGILQIVFDDFAGQYAIATCAAACADFLASVAGNAPVEVASWSGEDVTKALYAGASASIGSGKGTPDTLWVSPDVWANLGGSFNAMGVAAFPSLSLTSTGGNPLGLRLVVDHHFPAGTAVMGPSALAEWYEDVDGLMQIGEPDVLGQLVGYAGYAAFLNVEPSAFTKFTAPPVGP